VTAALAIDQVRRPADAIAFAEALRKGLHGIAPPLATASTAALGTGATRVISRRDDPTAATRMASRPRTAAAEPAVPTPARRLEPRRYATDPYQRAPAAYTEEQRRPRSGGRRALVGLLVGLLFAAAVVIALLISTSTSPTVVDVRSTAVHDAQSAINAMSNFISKYTK
jgi:hypothetical protein